MDIENFKYAEKILSDINDLKAYKESIEHDTGGDWFCDVKQLFPEIYKDLKVYICMLFDNKIEEFNNDFKAL